MAATHTKTKQVSLLLAALALLNGALECSSDAAAAATAAASGGSSSAQTVPTEQEATTCLRDLNSYLDKQGFGKQSDLTPSVDWPTTSESIRESLGKLSQQLEVSRQNPELVSDEVAMLSSAACNSDALLALAQNLRDATAPTAGGGACDQPSVDLLMIVANYDLGSGAGKPRAAVLNEFARYSVDTCWQTFVGSVSRRLDRVLGKMTNLVFSFVEALSRSVRHAEAMRGQEGQVKEIRIQEGKPQDEVDEWGTKRGAERTSLDARKPGALREAVDALKQLKVDTEQARRTFARAVNEMFEVYSRRRNKERLPEEKIDDFFRQFFVRPCGQLVERVQAIVGQGSIFRNHIKLTLGQALADEKRSNPRLDYELQMFRICKLANQQSQNIIVKLLDIRRRIDFQLDSSDLYDDWY